MLSITLRTFLHICTLSHIIFHIVELQNGSLLVGGTARHDITVSPFHLARNRHHILGISLGTKQQLYSLIQLVAEHQLATPTVHTYSLDRINEMYKDLREAKVIGRAVIHMSPDANGN